MIPCRNARGASSTILSGERPVASLTWPAIGSAACDGIGRQLCCSTLRVTPPFSIASRRGAAVYVPYHGRRSASGSAAAGWIGRPSPQTSPGGSPPSHSASRPARFPNAHGTRRLGATCVSQARKDQEHRHRPPPTIGRPSRTDTAHLGCVGHDQVQALCIFKRRVLHQRIGIISISQSG